MIPRIVNAVAPISPERREYLEKKRGLVPHTQLAIPRWADPDASECFLLTLP